ncbi:MAG: propionate--CoA ligase [Betaproteobacteria bacterium TMED156]|nr:MAG: propionate--CoA ligase [Betaproteobacteria bacterium TMED156]
MSLNKFHLESISNKKKFWKEQAKYVSWFEKPKTILDYTNPPFSDWYPDGKINLCHNAIDRHLIHRADQPALIYVSTEIKREEIFTFKQMHLKIQEMAAVFVSLGVRKGDRIIVYMPMIPEGVFAMLACARIGAIHSVVFGGFASKSLAIRIDDATPKLIITADSGVRGGKIISYKKLVDEACEISLHSPKNVVVVDRKLSDFQMNFKRDIDYKSYSATLPFDNIPCEKLFSNETSYILYTSGTTGIPKGIQRDTGGYAVALASSMKYIYDCQPGEVFFCASDIGWVVGHSYLVYAPLINGCTTILYEGLPINPDPGIWWSLVEKFKVSTMFTSPTAIRVLKKQDRDYFSNFRTTSLRKLFLAGEPLDRPTAKWISSSLRNTEIIDNYWQTETGWPILSAQQKIQKIKLKYGSPSLPVYGYDVELFDENSKKNISKNQKGILCINAPLPPGCLQTIWNDDKRFVNTYFTKRGQRYLYSTFDYAKFDEEGYFFILGRTDDVINVSGHRLGTREIEEVIQSNKKVTETAVVGVSDEIKGQIPTAFIVHKDIDPSDSIEDKKKEADQIRELVNLQLGPFARPEHVYFVKSLPKTRSGKLLRRAIQSVIEGKETGDLTTLEDPTSLEAIRNIFN